MKNILIITLCLLSLRGFSQRQFPDFPEQTTTDTANLLILWDEAASRNEKVQFKNILYNDYVKKNHLNSNVVGEGLLQETDGRLSVNVDGTSIDTVSGQLVVIGSGDLSGQSPYIFSSVDDADTFRIVVDELGANFYSDNSDGNAYYISGASGGSQKLIAVLSPLASILYYNQNSRLTVGANGVEIDTVVYLNGTNVYIKSDGSTMTFYDVTTGAEKTLSDLAAGGLDYSVFDEDGIHFNNNNALETSSGFTYQTSGQLLINSTTGAINSGNYNTIANGVNVTINDGYCFIPTGSNVTLNGQNSYGMGTDLTGNEYYSSLFGNSITSSGRYNTAFGLGLLPHDYGETVIGHYNVIENGNTLSINSANRLFCVANGTGSGARDNAFEVFASGYVYAEDSIGTNVLKANTGKFADSIFIMDTWFESGDIAGGGEVDTNGFSEANQIAVFTSANKIGGDTTFTWDDLNLKIHTSDQGGIKLKNEFGDSAQIYWGEGDALFIQQKTTGAYISIADGDEGNVDFYAATNSHVGINATGTDGYVRINTDSVRVIGNTYLTNDFTVTGKTTLGDAQSDTLIANGWFKNVPMHYKAGFADSTITITGGDSIQITNGDSLFRVADMNGIGYGGSDTITITYKGGYFINFNQRGYGNTGTDWKTELAYVRGGTTYYDEYDELEFSTTGGSNKNGGSITFYDEFEAGDKIYFITTRTAGTGDFTMTSGSIIIRGYLTP